MSVFHIVFGPRTLTPTMLHDEGKSPLPFQDFNLTPLSSPNILVKGILGNKRGEVKQKMKEEEDFFDVRRGLNRYRLYTLRLSFLLISNRPGGYGSLQKVINRSPVKTIDKRTRGCRS